MSRVLARSLLFGALLLPAAASATEHVVHQHGHAAATSEPPLHGHSATLEQHASPLPASPAVLPLTPIPELTDADRAAAFPDIDHRMSHGSGINSMVLFNRLETWDADGGNAHGWEGSAWIGGDIHRVWLHSEGERESGRTVGVDLELLYGRSVSPWWDVVAGVRQDFEPVGRTWAALGVQGLAPHMLETRATLYVDDAGHAEARLEVEYELLLTNRLVLQPLLELGFAVKDDPQRLVASGGSSAEAGLRLRYEIDRRFAPYVGLVHERSLGGTASLRRAAGRHARDTRMVAGVRIWF